MDDLIRRADLLEVFRRFPATNDAIPKNAVEALIEDAPVADGVVHGEWEDNTGWLDSAPQYKCSNCGKPPILSHNWVTLLTNFCPNCGAKMDGKEEGAV